MTAPPGYLRARTVRARHIDAIWAALRAAGRRGISIVDLAEATGASRTRVRTLIQAARDAGWVEVASVATAPAGAGAASIPHYRLTREAPREMPPLVRAPGWRLAIRPAAGLSGRDLARLRHEQGWSVREAAQRLDLDPRTVRRYERLPLLPPGMEERMARALSTDG